MAGINFDDLIPSTKQGVSFDDLIPASRTPQKPELSDGADVFVGLGSGMGRGVASIPGFAGDVQQLARMAPFAPKRSMLDALLEKGGFSKDLPTSADTIKAASKMIPAPTDGRKPFLEYEPSTTAGQYAQKIGEFIPNMYGGEGKIGAQALRYAVAPAVASKMAEDAAKGTGYEGAASALGAIGGGIGAGLIRQPGRAARPASAGTRGVFSQDPTIANHVKTLEDAGVTLSAGDRTGSKALQWMEDAAGKVPYGRDLKEESRAQLNKAMFDKAGVGSLLDKETKQFTPDTFEKGDANFSHWYKALNDSSHVAYTPQFGNELGKIEKQYDLWTNSGVDKKKAVTDWFEKLRDIGVNGGKLSGPDAQAWRSDLAGERKRLRNSADSPEFAAFDSMVKLMDNSLNENTPAHLQAARDKVNRAYSNYKLLESAAGTAGSNKGYISPANARSMAKQRNLTAYNRGTSDIGELAKAAEAVMKEKPSSGTAERGIAASLLSSAGGPAMVLKAMLASRAITSDPVQRLLGGKSRAAIPARKATPLDRDAIMRAGILGLLGGSN